MKLLKKMENFQRYKNISLLFMKYGQSDIIKQAGMDEVISEELSLSPSEVAKAETFAKDLENLGTTYIKLGQLLSTRADVFPQEYLDSLERLQDKIEPFPYEVVEQTILEELGVRISKAFSEFDKTPKAAASIGQVHRAKLRDGREVVVKVQRPGVRMNVYNDLEALEDIAGLLDDKTKIGKRYGFTSILLELKKSLIQELDYLREAENLSTLRKNLKGFKKLIVPKPIKDYTSSKVLTMEYIDGVKITDLNPVTRIGDSKKKLADKLFHAYLQQILVDGFYHADPHPGNLLITRDNKIGLIDLGMTGRLSTNMQDELLNLLLAICEGRGEEAARIALKLGTEKEDFQKVAFVSRVSNLVISNHELELKAIDAGKVMLDITKISAETGFRVPPELTMIAKTLLNLDRAVYTLDPDFCPNDSIRKHAHKIVAKRVMSGITPGTIFSESLELKQFVEKVPHTLNKLLNNLAENELKVQIDALDETKLMVGFQKIANRITMGLVFASLIIGGSMIMNIETPYSILGYPLLSILLFLAAALGGIHIIYSMTFKDSK
ncbi:MAG: AarF/UbiB family protein [Lentisphaeraceae bacterium]|nr:AarF/UbiB family protein [Lentisphaeraceae bacterium]